MQNPESTGGFRISPRVLESTPRPWAYGEAAVTRSAGGPAPGRIVSTRHGTVINGPVGRVSLES